MSITPINSDHFSPSPPIVLPSYCMDLPITAVVILSISDHTITLTYPVVGWLHPDGIKVTLVIGLDSYYQAAFTRGISAREFSSLK